MPRGVGALILLAAAAWSTCAVPAVRAEAPDTLPPPFDSHRAQEAAGLVFGVLAGRREAWLADARLWELDGETYLAVLAEASRRLVDGAICFDCARPLRLALLRRTDKSLVVAAVALVTGLPEGASVSLRSSFLDRHLGEDGVFPLTDTEQLLPVVVQWDAGQRPRASLSLYRLTGRQLVNVFTRRIFDDPTAGNPNLSGMRARIRMGELDPGGQAGFADIRFVERYFTRFADEIVPLDDRRIEVWVFGGERYSLVQCELRGPMGYGACVQ